jgi:Polysaccharide deacetylase
MDHDRSQVTQRHAAGRPTAVGFDPPVFVLTSDVDWASEDCIEDLLAAVRRFGIRPVVMATGRSATLDRYLLEDQIEIGVHPNFLPGSSHGADVASVIDHVLGLYPQAQTFRSHCFVDSSPIAEAFVARGLRYDSNLCLYLQRAIVPLRHSSGLVRFPVFWEDDVHWTWQNGVWDLDAVFAEFLTPGLKILNVHPFNFALNIPNEETYRSLKRHIPSLRRDEIETVRHQGPGTRSFVLDLLRRLEAIGARFQTLSEVHRTCMSCRSAG